MSKKHFSIKSNHQLENNFSDLRYIYYFIDQITNILQFATIVLSYNRIIVWTVSKLLLLILWWSITINFQNVAMSSSTIHIYSPSIFLFSPFVQPDQSSRSNLVGMIDRRSPPTSYEEKTGAAKKNSES